MRDVTPIKPQDQLALEFAHLVETLTHTPAPDTEEAALIPILGTRPLPEDCPFLISPTGYPRSGKDIIADYLQVTYKGVERLAFSDVIVLEVNKWLASEKDMAHHKIHSSNKSWMTYRKLLQVWGIARRQEDPDYWVKILRARVLEIQEYKDVSCIIMTGARDASDVALVKNLGGVIWRIIREGNPYTADSPIEHALDHLEPEDYDAVIYNNREGDLLNYLRQVEAIIWGSDLRIKSALGYIR